MNFLNFILALTIIILAAKASGYISVRLRQPAVLGELLAGLLLGPTVLDMFHAWPIFQGDEHLAESVALMAELGVILLMLLAGLELHLSELLKSGRVAALAGVLGVIFPLGMGWGTARLFGVSSDEALLLGLTLSATSVSISAQTLMELGVLRSRVGLALLGAAVFDDILVILMLSITSILVGGAAVAGGFGDVVITVVRMVGYLVIASLVGAWVLPRLAVWVDRLPISEGSVAFVLIISLFYAWTAEIMGGVAAITGAFIVGLFLAQTPLKGHLEQGVSTLAYALFVPIFFVNIGLEVNMRAIGGNLLLFALVITAVAVISKLVGSGIGARLGGMTSQESIRLGIGMVSRGEVGLIVAAFALSEGLLSQENFSIAVFMVIVATLLTPPMLRASYAREKTVTEQR